MPYDLYLLNDFNRIDPDKYKLYIFLDAFCLTDEQRDYINNTVKKQGRVLLFVGACDYVSNADHSLQRTEDMIEMQLGMLGRDENTVLSCGSSYEYKSTKIEYYFHFLTQ